MELILIFFSALSLSSAITIECNYRDIYLTTETSYGCDGTHLTDGNDREITSVTGNHKEGRSNYNTDTLRIWKYCTLEMVPNNIVNFYPNLIALWLNGCGIPQISAEDFKNLSHLIELDLASNKIRYVHENSFSSLKELQFLYMRDNKIIFVGPNVLQPLHAIKYVGFNDNSCISSSTFNFVEEQVRNFIIDLAIQCPLTVKIAESMLQKKETKTLKNLLDDFGMYIHDKIIRKDEESYLELDKRPDESPQTEQMVLQRMTIHESEKAKVRAKLSAGN